MQAGRDARPHEFVIGRMELDHVAAEALRVEGVEFRRVLIGAPRRREHPGRAPLPSEGGERRRLVACAIHPHRLL